MSAASEVNLKQSLRKLEFPTCAKEALHKIGELISGRTTSIKNMDLALNLVSEFVFYETDRRANKRPAPLSPLLELQLLEILYEHFTALQHAPTRNTVFLSLFSGATAAQRAPLLTKLVSLAIAIPSPAILEAASALLQQLGTASPLACRLAAGLVHDYFHLTPTAADRMRVLAAHSPPFAANLLAAIAETHLATARADQPRPPAALLDAVALWVGAPRLCTAAQQRQPALPAGAIAMEATAPFAGLVRWCALAPLCGCDGEAYARLHVAVLGALLEVQPAQAPKAVSAQHLAVPLRQILLYAGGKGRVEERLQVAIDRYAQALQIALANDCVYGKVDELMGLLEQLPHNKLMRIVINTHRGRK